MKVLSNYILFKKMAAGGMAELYKARKGAEDGPPRLFAAKMVLPHLAESGEFIKMLVDEARVASHLDHGNIVRIHDLVKADNSYCIVMEYVRGKDLRKVVSRSRKAGLPLSVENACSVALALLAALSYAHSKRHKGRGLGIVHRDVSPPNILISYDGEVKLADFGIARAAGRDTRTKTGVLKGKFAYMSPEQARGRAVDARSDIFSLGSVMYEMLAGRKLFSDDSEVGTLRKVWAAKVEAPPSKLNKDVSPGLEAIVLKALAKGPDDRYSSAAEMLEALTRLVKEEGMDAGPAPLASLMRRLFGREIEAERKEDEELLGCRIQADGTQDETRVDTGPMPEALKFFVAATVLLLVLAGVIHKRARPGGSQLAVVAAPTAATAKAKPPVRRRARQAVAAQAPARPQAPVQAVASISSVPAGALVYVDGVYAGRAPLDYKDIQDGKEYTVKVVRAGYNRWSGSFTGRPGLRETLHAELTKESQSDDMWANIFPKVPSTQSP